MMIRPYQPEDRDAIRRICCDTADAGQPVENFFGDRELVADLVTRYYTDYEPGSSWVADCEGHVAGYLTGGMDTRRCRSVTVRCIAPVALWRSVRRGILWQRQTWRFMWTTRRQWHWPTVDLETYPAHLHLNVDRAYRGQQIGRRLIERFLAQAKAAGVKGVHACVRSRNTPACRFFEEHGFRTLTPTAHETLVYAKKL